MSNGSEVGKPNVRSRQSCLEYDVRGVMMVILPVGLRGR